MNGFDLAAIVFGAAALVGFVNERWLHLPRAIGLLFVALCASLLLLGLERLVPGIALTGEVRDLLRRSDLGRTLFDGALGLLLFAGGLKASNEDLWRRRWTILMLVTLGVVVTICVLGPALRGAVALAGLQLSWAWCFVGAAVLAPTDPVAVPQVTQDVALPDTLRATIVGESLLNDGVSVVAFTLLLGVASAGADVGAGDLVQRFARAALGAACLGLAAGWLVSAMIRRVDEYNLEVLLTLALALGTYAAAEALDMSGPIAVVAASLVIGDRGVREGMSEVTRRNLRTFWSLVDELFNAVLFVAIGFELLLLEFDWRLFVAAALAVPAALLARFAGVLPPALLLHLRLPHLGGALAIMSWGGLRGGVSVALALSLPIGQPRDVLLAVCYAVVVFNVLVQGLTLRGLAARVYGTGAR
jgi:monovalent cation:H+ antiporter, CPA1 family